jgi:hypothetical protein
MSKNGTHKKDILNHKLTIQSYTTEEYNKDTGFGILYYGMYGCDRPEKLLRK